MEKGKIYFLGVSTTSEKLVTIEGSISQLSTIQKHVSNTNKEQSADKPYLISFATDAINGIGKEYYVQRFHLSKNASSMNNFFEKIDVTAYDNMIQTFHK